MIDPKVAMKIRKFYENSMFLPTSPNLNDRERK